MPGLWWRGGGGRLTGFGRGSYIEVFNDYQWIGDPRMAAFGVYIDGVRAGAAPLGQSLHVSVKPGVHTVRVRLWWFCSPRVVTSLKPGETVRFGADIPRKLPVLLRMLRLMFDPMHSLSLVASTPAAPADPA